MGDQGLVRVPYQSTFRLESVGPTRMLGRLARKEPELDGVVLSSSIKLFDLRQ